MKPLRTYEAAKRFNCSQRTIRRLLDQMKARDFGLHWPPPPMPEIGEGNCMTTEEFKAFRDEIINLREQLSINWPNPEHKYIIYVSPTFERDLLAQFTPGDPFITISPTREIELFGFSVFVSRFVGTWAFVPWSKVSDQLR
jgi:hypothetical protein